MKNYTDYDMFIRRPADIDHRDRFPTADDVIDIAIYLSRYGRETDKETIRNWLIEEHCGYIAEGLK